MLQHRFGGPQRVVIDDDAPDVDELHRELVDLPVTLALAGIDDIDAPNENVASDFYGSGQQPSQRNTGVSIQINMDYYNRNASDALGPGQISRNVDVDMNVTLKSDGWQSIGPKTYYIVYPASSKSGQYGATPCPPTQNLPAPRRAARP